MKIPTGLRRRAKELKRMEFPEWERRRKIVSEQPWVKDLLSSLPADQGKVAASLFLKNTSFVVFAVQKLGGMHATQCIPLLEEVLKFKDHTAVGHAAISLAQLESVESAKKIEPLLKSNDDFVRTSAKLTLGQFAKSRNRAFFRQLEGKIGKPFGKEPISFVLKSGHIFPDGTKIEGHSFMDQRILELRVDGMPKCILGFHGTTISFMQGIKNEGPVKGLFEELASRYLLLMKPLIINGEKIRINIDPKRNLNFTRPMYHVRERFFDRRGELNLNKRRTKQLLGL